MFVQAKERWLELCEQAADEQNPRKLMDFAAEIEALLEAKKTRLASASERRPQVRKADFRINS